MRDVRRRRRRDVPTVCPPTDRSFETESTRGVGRSRGALRLRRRGSRTGPRSQAAQSALRGGSHRRGLCRCGPTVGPAPTSGGHLGPHDGPAPTTPGVRPVRGSGRRGRRGHGLSLDPPPRTRGRRANRTGPSRTNGSRHLRGLETSAVRRGRRRRRRDLGSDHVRGGLRTSWRRCETSVGDGHRSRRVADHPSGPHSAPVRGDPDPCRSHPGPSLPGNIATDGGSPATILFERAVTISIQSGCVKIHGRPSLTAVTT